MKTIEKIELYQKLLKWMLEYCNIDDFDEIEKILAKINLTIKKADPPGGKKND